uniref:DUF2877 domain-containing protein n=1 Tax=Candidatus Enterococcus willemsii TaxID=1857215 RepID=UPI00403F3EBF
MHEFKHTINFGVADEVMLTISSHPLSKAPFTIQTDCIDPFSVHSITIIENQLIDDTQILCSFDKNTEFECKPLIAITKENSTFLAEMDVSIEASANNFDYYARKLIQERLEKFNLYWHNQQLEEATQELCNILGLGIGLTPTGDDVITGIFASLHALQNFPQEFKELKKVAKIRTNAVSYAEIREALDGRFSQVIANVFVALSNESEMEILQAIDMLKLIGSTSGSDMLWGIRFGLTL